MSESDPKADSNMTVTVIGVSNLPASAAPFMKLPTFYSVSYSSATTFEPLAGSLEWEPSTPLKPGAVRVINSVLDARVPESAIERDDDGDF